MNKRAVALGLVRIRGAGADTTALRLRAARELQAADLSPAGLPPAAVLVVRRLEDPMPGQFGCGRTRPRPEWEAAVRGALQTSALGAARPDRGRIDPAANAVLFADEAEIVACLIADMIRGDVAAHWWWHSVLPRLDLAAAMARAGLRDPVTVLRERARETPAAISLLSSWGDAPRLAAAISPSGAAVVLAALAQAHGLDAGLVTWAHAVTSSQPTELRQRSAEAIAPWHDALPRDITDRRLAPILRCLFGVALALHATPWRLRSAAAVARARQWWSLVAQPSSAIELRGARDAAAGDAPSSATGEPPASTAPQRLHDTFDPVVPSAGNSSEPGDETGLTSPDDAIPPRDRRVFAPAGESDAAHEPRRQRDRPRSSAPPAPAPRLSETRDEADAVAKTAEPRAARPRPPTPQPRETPRADRNSQDSHAEPAPSIAADVDAVRPEWPGQCVVTRVGGLLYLIHALENLGVPDAFEERWALASQGGPWGALDLIGRALLGKHFAKVADDPLWPLLARLAAWRPVRRGGPDPAFHIPAEWRSLLDDRGERFHWTARDGRVWIWSGAGYLVAHRAWRASRPPDAAAVRRELARAGAPAHARIVHRRHAAPPLLPSPALPAGCPARYGRLAAAIAPAVRRRLLLALGQAAHRSRRDRMAELLTVRARLYVSSSHLDLVTSLDRADLAIRRAGLDRDPGWLPGYGRVIYFHFS